MTKIYELIFTQTKNIKLYDVTPCEEHIYYTTILNGEHKSFKRLKGFENCFEFHKKYVISTDLNQLKEYARFRLNEWCEKIIKNGNKELEKINES